MKTRKSIQSRNNARYFDEAAFKRMVVWLAEMEEIRGAMEY